MNIADVQINLTCWATEIVSLKILSMTFFTTTVLAKSNVINSLPNYYSMKKGTV